MKTIGLLGGVSWHSTLEYYRLINEITNKKLGGNHSACIFIYSFNYNEIKELHSISESLLYNRLIKEARNLEKAGADLLLIGANTLHMFYEIIQQNINIPIIHVADAVSKKIKEKGHKKVALLGTIYTMAESFYTDRLKMNEIEAVVPNETDRSIISEIIYKELVIGIISEASKTSYLNIVNKIKKEESVEGVVLACTEIPLLLKEDDLNLPSYNSTEIHANEAVCYALGE